MHKYRAFIHKPSRFRSSGQRRTQSGTEISGVYVTLAVLFLLGAAVGAFVGVAGDSSVNDTRFGMFFIDTAFELSFFEALWDYGRFLIIALLLATSLLGVVAAPGLMGVYGYFLSLSCAGIVSVYGDKGLLLSLTSVALPAVFILPCLMLLCLDAFSCSRELISLAAGASGHGGRTRILRHCMVVVPVTITGAALRSFLVPLLIQLII